MEGFFSSRKTIFEPWASARAHCLSVYGVGGETRDASGPQVRYLNSATIFTPGTNGGAEHVLDVLYMAWNRGSAQLSGPGLANELSPTCPPSKLLAFSLVVGTSEVGRINLMHVFASADSRFLI